jgi:CRP/FNR family transcriptional regulator
MISREQLNHSLMVLPILQRAGPQEVFEFQQCSYSMNLPAGKIVFSEGDRANAIALVLSGAARVFKIGKNGRQITLYRFSVGDFCILTANAILNNQPFPANATVEQQIEAVMIPEDVFREWVQRYSLWREFVFNMLSARLTNMLTLVDEVLFRSMEARIASYLLQHSRPQNPIYITHQEIAMELGSSREVISRILKGFVASGLIRSVRGLIEVLDFDYLNSLANG